MILTIQAPEKIQTQVRLPASKSISNRMLILNALSKSPYPIENLSDSDDTRVLQNALTSNQTGFDIGAAGTSMRFLTAYLSQSEGVWTITGTERMRNRPIKILVDALREIGGTIEYLEKEGFPPLRIYGQKLAGGSLCLNGDVSSQYISALMMIAPCLQNGLVIRLEGDIVSKPYLEMTIRLMSNFGITVFWDEQTIRIERQNYHPVSVKVESDWSAASYWYEIAALDEDARIELLGLEKNSVQGDSKCEELFEILDLKSKHPFLYDFTNEPDLAQTFAVTCCLSDIPFRFTGLQSLRIKETDRISALQTELKKLGYLIQAGDSSMEWNGLSCEPLPDPVISTYEDHRMAMAFAPVCLKTRRIRIENPEVVSKSYPGFWEDLRNAGFSMEVF
jgi:3-phosphoshikimate 1-carboxyvinyltransferase